MRPDLLMIMVLVAFILISNGNLIFNNRIGIDPATFDHDFQVLVPSGTAINVQGFREGMPLWNKYWMYGVPSLGFMVTAVCHPGKVLTLFFDFPAYFKVHYLLYALICAGGYYLLLRRLGLRPVAGLIVAMWAVSAGFNYWQSLFEHSWRTIALYPWFNLALLRLLKRPRLLNFIVVPALIYLSITAGDAEMFTVGYLGSAWFFTVYALTSGRGFREVLSRLALLGLATAAGIILTSVQVAPFLEMAAFSSRDQGFSYDFFRASFDPWHHVFPAFAAMASRFTPFHFGVFAFFAAGWAAVRARRNPLALAVLIVLALAILAMMARGTPLTWVMYHLPVLGKLIRHYKWVIVINFHLLLLLGLGLEHLFQTPANRRTALIAGAVFILDALLNPFPLWVKAVALASGLAAAAAWSRPSLRRWAPALVALQSLIVILPKTLDDGGPIMDYDRSYSPAYQTFAAQHHDQFRSQVMYPHYYRARQEFPFGKLPLQMGTVGQSYAMDSWFSYPAKHLRRFALLLEPEIVRVAGFPDEEFMMKASFKSFDFITPQNRRLVNLLGLKYIYTYDFALRQADVYPLFHSPAWIEQPLHQGLVTEERPDSARVPPGESLHFEFEGEPGDELRLKLSPVDSVISGDLEVTLKWGDTTLNLVGTIRESGEKVYPLALDQTRPVTLELSLAQDAAHPVEIVNPRLFNPFHTIKKLPVEGLDVYENTEVLARAFLIEDIVAAADDESAAALMSDPAAFDPARTAVVPAPAPDLGIAGPRLSTGRVEWRAYLSDRVDLDVESERGGLLFLTDNYYPGWKAYVDGVETRIHRADLTFRGVQAGPGRREVVFSYQPDSFRIGLWQTLTAAFLLLALGVFSLLRRSRRPAPVAPGR